MTRTKHSRVRARRSMITNEVLSSPWPVSSVPFWGPNPCSPPLRIRIGIRQPCLETRNGLVLEIPFESNPSIKAKGNRSGAQTSRGETTRRSFNPRRYSVAVDEDQVSQAITLGQAPSRSCLTCVEQTPFNQPES